MKRASTSNRRVVKKRKPSEEEVEWLKRRPKLRTVAAVCHAMGVPGYRDIAGVIRDTVGAMTRCLYCHRPGPHAKQCCYGPVCAQCFESQCVPPEFAPRAEAVRRGRCSHCGLDLGTRQAIVSWYCPDHYEEPRYGALRVDWRDMVDYDSSADEAVEDWADEAECVECGDRLHEAQSLHKVGACFPCFMGFFSFLQNREKRRRHTARLPRGLRRWTFRRFLLSKKHPGCELCDWAHETLPEGSDWEH